MRIGTTFAISLVLWAFIWGGYLYFGEKELRGQVIDELSGEPVAGVTVLLGGQAQESDGQGQFLFSAAQGLLPLTVTKPGYLATQGDVQVSGLLVKQVPVYVLLRPNQLSLHLFDAQNGEPVEGGRVLVGGAVAEGDGNGGFILRRLFLGQVIFVSAANYLPQELAYDGRTQLEVALQPELVTVQIKDLYTGEPVSGAIISWPGAEATSDANGAVFIRIPALVLGELLSAAGPGYATMEMAYAGQELVEVFLRPSSLSGTVRDDDRGEPLAGVEIFIGDALLASTDSDGVYSLQDLPAGATLLFRAPGYEEMEVPLPAAHALDISLQRQPVSGDGQPVVAQGVYLNLGLWFVPQRMWEILAMVDRTELNAIVVDIKGDGGRLVYPSQIPLAQEAGASLSSSVSVAEVLLWAKERGIYTIARMVVFKDPVLATHRPDLAVHRADGSLLADGGGALWVDPFREEVWEYNLDLAREVAELGFDEIQFDYIRFPSDGPVRDAVYSEVSTEESRRGAIRGFMARAQEELKPLGAAISADIFAITAWVEDDQGIGQTIEDVAPYVDYLSLMVYPSTFTPGVGGYDVPTAYPYEIVYQTLARVRERSGVILRPWLQHFGDYRYHIPYGLTEYLAQKQAAIDAGATGWLFWNALGVYDERLFISSAG